jgi:hypothetical protein
MTAVSLRSPRPDRIDKEIHAVLTSTIRPSRHTAAKMAKVAKVAKVAKNTGTGVMAIFAPGDN